MQKWSLMMLIYKSKFISCSLEKNKCSLILPTHLKGLSSLRLCHLFSSAFPFRPAQKIGQQQIRQPLSQLLVAPHTYTCIRKMCKKVCRAWRSLQVVSLRIKLSFALFTLFVVLTLLLYKWLHVFLFYSLQIPLMYSFVDGFSREIANMAASTS